MLTMKMMVSFVNLSQENRFIHFVNANDPVEYGEIKS